MTGDNGERMYAPRVKASWHGSTGNANVESVGVVIPARNAARTIGDCLRRLLRQVPPDRLVVINDGSEDETAEIAIAIGARLVSSGGGGPAAARNLGARLVAGEVLMFVDADVLVPAGFVARMVGAMEASGADVIQARYSAHVHPTHRLTQYQQVVQHTLMQRLTGVDIQEVGSFAVAFRRNAFEGVGGFDESIRQASMEDHEIGYRLHAAGFRMVLAPDLFVDHDCFVRGPEFVRKRFERARAYAKWFMCPGIGQNRGSLVTRKRSYLGRRFLVSVFIAPWMLVAPVVVLATPLPHYGFGTAITWFLFLGVNAELLIALWRRTGMSPLLAWGFRWAESIVLFFGAGVGVIDGIRSRAVRGMFGPSQPRSTEIS